MVLKWEARGQDMMGDETCWTKDSENHEMTNDENQGGHILHRSSFGFYHLS